MKGPAPQPASFETDAAETLRRLRTTLAALVAAAPGAPSQPTKLVRALDIDMKLSWSLFQIITATDLLAAGQYVPRALAIRKFLAAATRQRLPSELVDGVGRAAADFERMVGQHAGDRSTFDLMISGRASNGADRIDLTHRRDAFRANSHIWGVQARSKLVAHFMHPGSAPGMMDGAVLRGLVGLRRIRPNVPWVIARARVCDQQGVMLPRSLQRTPLDWLGTKRGPDATHVPLLRNFCTRPRPRVRRVVRPDGFVDDELMEGPVGNTGAITCMFGDVIRNATSCWRTEDDRINQVIAIVRTPCEVLINDLFVHEDLFGPLAPELFVYSELQGGPGYPAGGSEPARLPVGESVEYLGKGPDVVATPAVPRYPELARYVFDRLEWDGQRFDVYRVRLPYPVLSSSVVLRHALPDRDRGPRPTKSRAARRAVR